jgi:hypothetical protein
VEVNNDTLKKNSRLKTLKYLRKDQAQKQTIKLDSDAMEIVNKLIDTDLLIIFRGTYASH